jgi:DNA-binding NarL/FixJ family response regulator
MAMTRAGNNGAHCSAAGPVHVLVISQHDSVRHQLVAYLRRSASLDVSGDEFSVGAIARSRPDVLVLDLSRLSEYSMHEALDASRQIGARVIALGSMRDASAEQAVSQAGGLYRLKSAGADGLADVVYAAAAERPVRAL